jgi:hypothetical protein
MEPYFQRTLVINNRELNYKGIFHHEEVFMTINKALKERGYQRKEKKTEELVTEEGKRHYVELRPFKDINNYCRLMIKIKVMMDQVEDHVEGRERFEKGNLTIIFDAWVLMDYEARWGMKPGFYFLKGLVDKFLYKFPYEPSFSGKVAEDTAYIYGMIKKLLMSYSPPEKQKFSEEEIIQKAREELGVDTVGES